MTRNVVIIDYGSGNTFSMHNALRRVVETDQQVTLTSDERTIRDADRLVLPGVGAFAECRRRLFATGLVEVVGETVRRGRPFLGVCVGMQILADEGHEFGVTPGLGWIPGTTKLMATEANSVRVKLPHVGWAPVRSRDCSLFDGIGADDYFYFVHSYALECENPSHVAATADYGSTFTAAVRKENVFGCQFHPEKSAHSGLRLLEGFCRWKP
jgi:imidazole glycerol-phosphate synthase subunit HisH